VTPKGAVRQYGRLS